MAKNKDNDSAVTEVKLEDEASVGVQRVEVPDEPSAEYLKEQDAALLHYKLTGEAGVYVDPSRDQETDIAPELGVSPHPELANPAPPKSSISAVAARGSVVQPVEEKEERGDEATSEALAAREEAAAQGGLLGAPVGAQPVYVVDAPSSAGDGLPPAPVSSSPKASDVAGPEGPQVKPTDSDADSDSK